MSLSKVPRVLYIAGYGRSGSTLLDVLLGAQDRAISVGELVYLGEEWRHEGRACACGVAYDRCPFWSDTLAGREEAEELMRVARRVEHRRSLPRLLSHMLPDRHRDAYRDRMRALFSDVAEREGADFIVDSSKSARHAAGRFWALSTVAGLDVRVIHLVRDGRNVLGSVLEKGTNWAAEGYRSEKALSAERTLLGWALANTIAWSLGTALDGDRYLRVQFEDLLDDPEQMLQKIGAFAGVDLSSVVRRVDANQAFSVGHNVGGNRIRHNNTIRLRRKNKEKQYPWRGLSPYHQTLFALFGQWLNVALGYKW